MPEISRFLGIIIRIYTETSGQHHTPHIRTYYQDEVATFRIDTGDMIAGSLPRRQQRLVQAWIELYRDELAEAWRRVDSGEPIKRIPPLTK